MHDAQLDYYGTTLATASSDHSIKIFDVRNRKQKLIAHLREHQGPVWGLSWSHPMYGNLLTSCSYDRKVFIWRGVNGRWERIYEYAEHTSSVNGICWAPHPYGLMLACASSDGTISIISADESNMWCVTRILDAHSVGVNSVSWSPAINSDFLLNPTMIQTPSKLIKRIVSGGCDSLIKIWRESNSEWIEEIRLEGHSDWVRDVAWAPNLDPRRQSIASCGQDGRVIVWQSFGGRHLPTADATTSDGGLAKQSGETVWRPTVLGTYSDVIWHVSWSVTGNVLAVSGADNKVTLWKQNLEDVWIALSEVSRGHQDQGSVIGMEDTSQVSNQSAMSQLVT